MEGLDYLGAGEGFANQYLVLRIKRIDADKLKSKLGSGAGTLAAAGLTIADAAPKAALQAAAPFILDQVKKYGIDAEITVSDVPPVKGGRKISEFFPGLVIGIGIGGASLVIIKLLGKLFAVIMRR